MQPSIITAKDKLPQFNTSFKTRAISNRLLPVVLIFSCVLSLPIYLFFHHTWRSSHSLGYPSYSHLSNPSDFRHPHGKPHLDVDDDQTLPQLAQLIPSKENLKGGTIMPKMANATAKAELGRATWKFMHTVTARFPEKPTPDEREALKAFIYLFSRLYPCGDCARHFQELLKKYPPQTSSRNTASLHLCSLHNMVNERLGKPEYNCTTLLENYDCGCGHDENDQKGSGGSFLTKIPGTSPIPSY